MAKKEIGAAGGAEIADKDALRVQASGEELRAIGLAEIEADIFRRGLVAGRLHVEPLERIGFVAGARFVEIFMGIGKLRGEFGDKVGGNFVATRADGRTDGGDEIRRLRVKLELHAADGLLCDASLGAAPTSMDGGDRALFWIHEKNGNTVGCLDGKKQTGAIGGGRVTYAGIRGRGRDRVKDGRVDLFERNKVEIGSADGGLKFAAIREDIFAGVPFHETEVENVFGFKSTRTARAGAESMNEPGELGKRSEFEDLKAPGLAEAPGRGDSRVAARGGLAGAPDAASLGARR